MVGRRKALSPVHARIEFTSHPSYSGNKFVVVIAKCFAIPEPVHGCVVCLTAVALALGILPTVWPAASSGKGGGWGDVLFHVVAFKVSDCHEYVFK